MLWTLTSGSTSASLLILTILTTSLGGCAGLRVSDSVVADRTLSLRQACAGVLADNESMDAMRAVCLDALEALAAGFGE